MNECAAALKSERIVYRRGDVARTRLVPEGLNHVLGNKWKSLK